MVDANGGRSTSVFDIRGNVIAEQDQLGAFTSYAFDPGNNTILKVDARNWPTTYTIDAMSRTAQTLYIDSTRVTNTWDSAGQQLTCQDVTGITSLIWDLDGRKTATQNPTGINLTNTLDPLGNRELLQDSYGSTSYTWDSQSRLLSIWNPVNERTTMQWDALDREQYRVLANGTTTSHVWDADGRETLLANVSALGVGQAIFTNSYSAVGNRLTVHELDGTLVTYSYDAISQLTSEARSGTYAYNTSYVYDPNGNRQQKWDSGALTTYMVNAANELLVVTPPSGAATTNTFDANGNLTVANTGGALTTNAWDSENRLTNIANPDGSSIQSVYSQDGLRKSKTTEGATTLYTWDEQNVLLETSTAGALLARNTDYPGYWGGLASQNRSGVSSFSSSCAFALSSLHSLSSASSATSVPCPSSVGVGSLTPSVRASQSSM